MLFLVSLVLIATSFVHERFARQLFVAREYQLVAKRSWRGPLPEQEVDPSHDDAGPGPAHVGLKLPETLKGRTVGMSRSHSEEGGEGPADSRTFWDRAGRLDQMLVRSVGTDSGGPSHSVHGVTHSEGAIRLACGECGGGNEGVGAATYRQVSCSHTCVESSS